jgi:hypothetical protein
MTRKNPHIGSDFDEFLAEEGILTEVEIAAAKTSDRLPRLRASA